MVMQIQRGVDGRQYLPYGNLRQEGTPWTFTDKITFRLVIDAALTPPVKRQLRAMASQHGGLMAVEEAHCSDIFRIGSAPAANVQKSVFRRHAEDLASQPHTAAGQRGRGRGRGAAPAPSTQTATTAGQRGRGRGAATAHKKPVIKRRPTGSR